MADLTQAHSAQGTVISRQDSGAGAFTAIAELRDITPPSLTRNAIETTNHNSAWDSYVPGIKRRGDLSFQIGWIPKNATHDHTTGLIKSWNDAQLDGFKITFPDGAIWLFSGYVTNVSPSAPVDDGLVADVTVKLHGAMSFL